MDERAKYISRWESGEGEEDYKIVLDLIRGGAGEDFLQRDSENGKLKTLENMWDLKGIKLFNENLTFPSNDTFEAIDFTYADFAHVNLTNATFYQSIAKFGRFYNVQFVNCVFDFSYFYGCKFQGVSFINCDFIEEDFFVNCDMGETMFQECYFSHGLFEDCKFDELSNVRNIRMEPNKPISGPDQGMEKLVNIYKSISNTFRNGECYTKAREWLFLQRKITTRIEKKWLNKANWLFVEYFAGYGLKPERALFGMGISLLIFCIIFSLQLGLYEGVILGTGSFFTFGANAERLGTLPSINVFLYTLGSFFGIGMTSLFVSLLVNRWITER